VSLSKISISIPADFGNPTIPLVIVWKLFGETIEAPNAPLTTVPEFTINEDREAFFANHEIRFANNVGAIPIETYAPMTKFSGQDLFRRRVGRAHPSHQIASL
jgi:hypothetical protein